MISTCNKIDSISGNTCVNYTFSFISNSHVFAVNKCPLTVTKAFFPSNLWRIQFKIDLLTINKYELVHKKYLLLAGDFFKYNIC